MTLDTSDKATRWRMIKNGLPHLHGRDWYTWAKDFYDSRNKMCLLCAANQISKSSTQIRKCIEWAGNPKLWPELWDETKQPPRQFWYLYPDKATATAEFELKWKTEFLPQAAFKNHKTYGWRETYGEKKKIESIIFNSGVTVYFKTYEQDAQNLQSGTVHAIFCDEELPEELYSELNARTFGTDGYFSMVFTATKNQDFWKRAIEGRGQSEKFPDAHKQQVSMYDCITYANGKPGAYTEERIKKIEASCKSQTEIDRRVKGKFVTELGRKYAQFDALRHFRKKFPIPSDWSVYTAVDPGSGGENHKPAVCFLAVRPDMRFGVVHKAWLGDDGPTYTDGDVYGKYLELSAGVNCVEKKYDQAAKDFGTISDRSGGGFTAANKSHDVGEAIINTLFKNDMLVLFTDDPEIEKLGGQLGSLMKTTLKRHADDDLADAFRYAVVAVPWDFTALQGEKTIEERKSESDRPYTAEERVAMEINERRGEFSDGRERKSEGWEELEAEFAEWNEAYGT